MHAQPQKSSLRVLFHGLKIDSKIRHRKTNDWSNSLVLTPHNPSTAQLLLKKKLDRHQRLKGKSDVQTSADIKSHLPKRPIEGLVVKVMWQMKWKWFLGESSYEIQLCLSHNFNRRPPSGLGEDGHFWVFRPTFLNVPESSGDALLTCAIFKAT